jgi:hypothetical protein
MTDTAVTDALLTGSAVPPSPVRNHVMIATPCFGGTVSMAYMVSILKLQAYARTNGFGTDILLLAGDALITRARQTLVANFLSQPVATHLLFIDADIGFEPEQVQRLLDLDEDFAAAFYPRKTLDWAELAGRVTKGGETPQQALMSYVGSVADREEFRVKGDFATAKYAGTGFQLIRRRVFERMIEAYPETRYRSIHTNDVPDSIRDYFYALFDCLIDPDSGVYLSEDYAFCKRWRDIGGTIWLDLRSRLTHVGSLEFHGDHGSRLPRRIVTPE